MIFGIYTYLKSYFSPGKQALLALLLVLLVLYGFESIAIKADEGAVNVSQQQNSPSDIPGHEIQYEDDLSPEWKAKWVLARQLYREKKYREALVQYELLLSQKENIDEARWEYTTLLLHQERWQDAGEQLEHLLAGDPENVDYLFSLAEVRSKTGNINAALDLYRKLYEKVKDKAVQEKVLLGLIKELEEKGDKEEVIFYLEKLIALDPGNLEPKVKIARVLLDIGEYEKARDQLVQLEKQLPDDTAVVQMQAELYEALGEKELQAASLQKLVTLNPDDLLAQEKLYQYYRDRQEWAMSLKHLEVLLVKKPNDPVLLEDAAEANLKLDRLDRALEYYDYLLALNPNNKVILQKKKDAQVALAEDLVVLVENNGSEKLWQDLVQVTSDRVGVYRQIANLLRKKNNTDELIEVLTLICLEDPGDKDSLAELTDLLTQKGRGKDLEQLLEKLQSRKNK